MLKSKFHKNVVTVLTGLAVLISMALPGAAEARVSVSDLVLQLTAVAADGSQANLQWALSDSASISGFEVERSLDPLTGYTVVSTSGRSDRSFVDQSVVAGQAYYYKVRAYKKSQYSAYSNVGFADIPADVPQEPVDVSPPNITLVSPTNNATFTTEQIVNISADAIDDIGVDRVDFFCDDILVSSDASAPYSYGWAVSQADNGQRSLKAKAYDKTGKEGVSFVKAVTVDIPSTPSVPVEYTTPVLESVQANGDTYTLNWSLPESAYGVPEGGYDLFADGVDDNLHHTGTSAVISGLQEGVEHCFQVEARWTQAATSLFLASNTLCAQSADNVFPSVSITSPASGTTYTSAQAVNIIASAQDNVGVSKVEFFEGSVLKASDSSAPYSFDLSFNETDNGSHSVTAKAYDSAGNVASSSVVSIVVDIPDAPIAPTEHTVPALKTVQANGGTYTLSWSLPESAYGVPEGGYDIFTDGVDDSLHHTGTSAVVTGLQEGVEHCFQVEARWTQAVPSIFNRSEIVCATASDTSAPTIVISEPAAGTTLTTAQTVNILTSTSDNLGVAKVEFYNGSVLLGSSNSAPFGYNWTISETDNGQHTFTAKAYDVAGNSGISAPVTFSVNIQPVTAEYTVPVLDYVQVSDSEFLVDWSQPGTAYGAPEGGYDLIIDGVDDNAHRTEQTAVISGLSAGVEHCFQVEARWTQAVPPVYPRSNQLCGTLEAVIPDVPPVLTGEVKVFPGAEGFGTDTVAGRGGQIIHVTNLNDSGAGSLREAVSTPGSRIIVFDVSGVIYLRSMLSISEPFLTIAGQTAPGDGIMLRDYGVKIKTNDVLIQHIAIRPGDEGAGPYDTLDGMQIVNPSYNVVIDHVSISWGVDENADTWTDVHDVTFSDNIISEGLLNSLHSDGDHSKGYLAGRRNKNIAFIGNLMAHNDTRNPMIYGETEMLMVNNVFYNAGAYSFSSIGDGWSDGPPQITAVGNVYLNGPNTTASAAIKIESSCPSGTRVYIEDNYYSDGSVVTGQTQYLVSAPPVPYNGISIITGEDNIRQQVLVNAGSRPASRDSADDRIANPVSGEVITGSGNWADCVSGCTNDAGGWPVYRSDARVFDAGVNPHGDDNGNGYTNVEEIIYQMSSQLGASL